MQFFYNFKNKIKIKIFIILKENKLYVYIRMLNLTIREFRSTAKEGNVDGYKNISKNY